MEKIIGPSSSALAWRGVASLVFGAMALAWPGITLASLIMLFGVYALVDGVFALGVAARRGYNPHRWLLVAEGLVDIAAGLVALLWPGIGLLALVLVIGVRALFLGVAQLGAAYQLRNVLASPWLMGIGGVATLLFGIAVLVNPAVSAFVMVTVLGVYALFFGAALLGLAYVNRRGATEPYIGQPGTA